MDNLPLPQTYDRRRTVRSRYELLASLAIAAAAAGLAVFLGGKSSMVIAIGLISIAALPAALIIWLYEKKLAATLLISALALSIPINLDLNLFYRHHVGGAPSITINLTLILIGIYYLVWIYRYAIGEQNHIVKFYPPLAWAAFGLLVLPLMSLGNALYADLVWLEWVRLVCLVLAMIATMSIQDERLERTWILVLSFQVLLQAMLAGAQYALQRNLGLEMFGEESLVTQNIGYEVSRATGTIGHPNVLSYFFEITLPVMLAMALTKQAPVTRCWYAIVFAAGVGGVLTTLSRGSWITMPFSFSIVLLFVYGHRIVRVKATAVAFLVGCLLIVAFLFAFPVIEKRFTHTDYKSAQSRKPLNIASLSIIEQFPVFGVGLNNFAETFKKYDETGLSRIFRGYRHVVHNLHLWIITEVGITGYLAYLAPFLVIFYIAWYIAPRAPPIPRGLLIGIAAGLLAHLAHGMVDPGFRVSMVVSLLIFMLIGLAGGIALRYR